AARLAATADAVLRVPAAAVGFPRHACVVTDLVDVEIALASFGLGGEVVPLALDVRAGSQRGDEHLAGVRAIEHARQLAAGLLCRLPGMGRDVFGSPGGHDAP